MATVGVPYTSSFVTMEMKTLYNNNSGHSLLYLASSLATVVNEVVRLKIQVLVILKILYPATCNCLVIFYIPHGLVLFRKGDFGRLVNFFLGDSYCTV